MTRGVNPNQMLSTKKMPSTDILLCFNLTTTHKPFDVTLKGKNGNCVHQQLNVQRHQRNSNTNLKQSWKRQRHTREAWVRATHCASYVFDCWLRRTIKLFPDCSIWWWMSLWKSVSCGDAQIKGKRGKADNTKGTNLQITAQQWIYKSPLFLTN